MSYRGQARTTAQRPPALLIAGLLLAVAAIAAIVGHPVPPPTSSRAASPVDVLVSADSRDALGEAGGAIAGGASVSDDTPGVANLDPALLRALREAATDAAGDGVELYVNSGWRSFAYQEQLLDEAVSKYGSREKAALWVGTPSGSAHVSGEAVDIGPAAARTWLSRHGAEYGLYQIYRNEPWHYELRPEGRPRMYPDPAHDPRMRQ